MDKNLKSKIKQTIHNLCAKYNFHLISIKVIGSYFIGINNEYSDIDISVIIIPPEDYYLGDKEFPEFEYNDLINLENDLTLDITYKDIRKLIIEYLRGSDYAADILLDGLIIEDNISEKLKQLLLDNYQFNKHLDRLSFMLNDYKDNLLNNMNGKLACRVIRDISRSLSIIENKKYLLLDDIFTPIKNNIIFNNIIERQRNGINVFLTNEEKNEIISNINYILEINNNLNKDLNKTKFISVPEINEILISLIKNKLFN